MQYEHGADDVLVMGTDGLWDVLSNQEVAEAVTTFLANCDPDDLHRWGTLFSFYISRGCSFTVVPSLVQVYNGSTGPGDASAWRAEGQGLEDHQRAPGLWR